MIGAATPGRRVWGLRSMMTLRERAPLKVRRPDPSALSSTWAGPAPGHASKLIAEARPKIARASRVGGPPEARPFSDLRAALS